jgi:hypothetical protein
MQHVFPCVTKKISVRNDDQEHFPAKPEKARNFIHRSLESTKAEKNVNNFYTKFF